MTERRYLKQLSRARGELLNRYVGCMNAGLWESAKKQREAIDYINSELERVNGQPYVEPSILQVQGAQIENAARNEWHGLEARIGFQREG